MDDLKERFTKNAADFDAIVSELILRHNAKIAEFETLLMSNDRWVNLPRDRSYAKVPLHFFPEEGRAIALKINGRIHRGRFLASSARTFMVEDAEEEYTVERSVQAWRYIITGVK
jgi:hypothetical protein